MDVKLPQLAEGVESGTVVNILVSEGQEVEKDQPIMELETQKAVGSIPSPQAGIVIKIHVREGMEVSVGQVLISIDNEQSTAPAAAQATARAVGGASRPPPAEAATHRQPAPGVQSPEQFDDSYRYQSKSGVAPPAAPSIRKIANDLGIDLSRIKGSETGGRIVLQDLRAYIQQLQEIATQGKPATVEKAGTAQAPKEAVDFSRWGPIRREKMSSVRRTVSQRMVQSWTTIPKIDQFDEADITGLLAFRKKYASAYEKKKAHLTLTPFVLKAVAGALKKHPRANASLDETANEIVFKDYTHIGVAVDSDAGLIVPVVRDVDKKNLVDLARELNELTEKTRQRKITVDELQGGTFTLSNQGSVGGSYFTPIIYAPQVAILGTGRGAPKAVVLRGKITIRTRLPLCLSYDHRVLDGADAVRFLRDIVAGLESFPEGDVRLK